MKWKESEGFIIPEPESEFSIYKDFPEEKQKIERKIKLNDCTIIITDKAVFSDKPITEGEK